MTNHHTNNELKLEKNFRNTLYFRNYYFCRYKLGSISILQNLFWPLEIVINTKNRTPFKLHRYKHSAWQQRIWYISSTFTPWILCHYTEQRNISWKDGKNTNILQNRNDLLCLFVFLWLKQLIRLTTIISIGVTTQFDPIPEIPHLLPGKMSPSAKRFIYFVAIRKNILNRLFPPRACLRTIA